MIYLIIVVVVIVAVVLYLKTYKIRHDTVIAFTGGLGSGKSFMSTKQSVKLLKKQRRKIRLYNFFHSKKKKRDKPMLYSNIPIRISKKENALVLKAEHLLLNERIVLRSVVHLDEVGSFASQFDFKAVNILENFDEYVRLFRHYTKGGYLVVNDQCSENIVLQIRRRLNQVYNLMDIRFYGIFKPLIYTVKVRKISISEEIKTIEERDTEDNMTTLFGIVPFKRLYDTYCYSDRYDDVPVGEVIEHKNMKVLVLLKCPKEKVRQNTKSA